MHPIIATDQLSPNVTRLVVHAPRIAEIRLPGQFVIVRLGPGAERIPLTIADADPAAGTITLIIQSVGKSTADLVELRPGDAITDVAGPLGKATDLIERGHAVCVGGGVGTAVILPIAQQLARQGVRVTSVIGGRSREWVILEQELAAAGEVVACTDDGSYGRPGFVTQALSDILETGPVDAVYAVGPVPMMRAVSELTQPFGVATTVSLNAIMVDGTGMCGGCRVSIDGRTALRLCRRPRVRRPCGRLYGAGRSPHDVSHVRARSHRPTRGLPDPGHGRRIRPHGRPGPRRSVPMTDPAVEPQPEASAASPGDELVRKILAGEPVVIGPKDRMLLDRVAMPEEDAERRSHSFEEVNIGYTERLAVLEAERCLQCKNPKCIDGCPVRVNIPQFIDLLRKGDMAGAADSLLDDNALPCVTGRVCPQEIQCEGLCLRGKKGKPVAIGSLERYVADWAQAHPEALAHREPAPAGRSVAIVGSGPAGLTAAGELAKHGYAVTIFEAFHAAGGVLIYGIPEFRLPKDIVQQEVDRLRASGVTIEPNAIIGKTFTLDDLRGRFDAVFLAVGAGLPVFMGVPGENLKGVYSANEYLTRVNLMGAWAPNSDTPVLHGQRVVVVGGGNVAMDSVRTARRLGAEAAMIVYRRGREELPARAEEVHHAEQEGVQFELLVAPLEVIGDNERWVTGLRCIRMELGEPDASGRRRPVPIEGSEFVIDCDMVVVAIGTRSNPILTASAPDLDVNEWGYIVTDEHGMTSIPGVFAGGDIVRGAATVILAMGDGKRAAAALDRWLRTGSAAEPAAIEPEAATAGA